MKKTILSGIAPSGNLHIGNYLGALKQWVDLQKDYQVFAMVADLHAITVPQDPKELHEKSLEVAKITIACGIDPKKSIVFLQSHVPAHAELAWILNTISPIGELERMIQFKDKSKKIPRGESIMAGLLNYPTLMASDILLYQTDAVPVGDDQNQHLELTHTLARRFNNKFGETFKEPKAFILKETARIMSLNDPEMKMSKSSDNPNSYVSLLDTPGEIRKKIRIAVTDSESEVKYRPEQKPAISNLMRIYQGFSGKSVQEIKDIYAQRPGYAEFKKDLAELLIEKLQPIQKRYHEISDTEIKKILKEGANKASEVADKTLRTAKEKMGFVL